MINNMDLKKFGDFYYTHKGLVRALIGLLIFLVIAIVVLIIVLNLTRRYSAKEMEPILVKAANKYMGANSNLVPGFEETYTVTYDELVTNGYIKERSKMFKDSSCDASVDVLNSNGKYRITPRVKCDTYERKSLATEITSKEKIVESGNGLYLFNNKYTYRGEFVNNYLKFDDYTWRIVKFDENDTYLILDGFTDEKNAQVFDDRYNESVRSNRGFNTYATSRIKDVLDNVYTEFLADSGAYINEHNICIGSRGELIPNSDGALECSNTISTTIGLLPLFDYLNASVDRTCNYSLAKSCMNYNYLSKLDTNYWLLTPDSDTTYKTYAVSAIGQPLLENSNAKKFVRPVIVIPSTLFYKSGNGTEASPYEIERFN